MWYTVSVMKKKAFIDPRGIPYSDDVACVPSMLQWHRRGYKNIYSVHIKYRVPKKGPDGTTVFREKVYKMDYGRHHLAMLRYNIETSTENVPQNWLLDEIQIFVQTYHNTRMVHEESLCRRGFGTQARWEGRIPRNRVAEELDDE